MKKLVAGVAGEVGLMAAVALTVTAVPAGNDQPVTVAAPVVHHRVGPLISAASGTHVPVAAAATRGGAPAPSPTYTYEVTNAAGVPARGNPCETIRHSAVVPYPPVPPRL